MYVSELCVGVGVTRRRACSSKQPAAPRPELKALLWTEAQHHCTTLTPACSPCVEGCVAALQPL
jgi:hypothetical protein